MTRSIFSHSAGCGFYVQVPFCAERCDYCSIAISARPDRAAPYIKALGREVERIRKLVKILPPSTFYIGGGTPTSLPLSQLEEILSFLPIPPGSRPEMTLEARPETLSDTVLEQIGKKGVTRLSVGIEAFSLEQMRFLGRKAEANDPVGILERIRSGFTGMVSMDFIVGGDGYDPDLFRKNALRLYDAGLDHLSVYPLALEPRTVLKLKDSRGELEGSLDDTTAHQWRRATEDLRLMGWHHYEISNFARDSDSICLHNVLVWKGGNYIGVGAGAHQKIGNVRTNNVRSIITYEHFLEQDCAPFEEKEELSESALWTESLYTNARLSYGIPFDHIVPYVSEREFSSYTDTMLRSGWIDLIPMEEGRLTFTFEGWIWLDELVGRLVSLRHD
jgi:oxygen-independent coproporphyrinogen-3 oxidase